MGNPAIANSRAREQVLVERITALEQELVEAQADLISGARVITEQREQLRRTDIFVRELQAELEQLRGTRPVVIREVAVTAPECPGCSRRWSECCCARMGVAS